MKPLELDDLLADLETGTRDRASMFAFQKPTGKTEQATPGTATELLSMQRQAAMQSLLSAGTYVQTIGRHRYYDFGPSYNP